MRRIAQIVLASLFTLLTCQAWAEPLVVHYHERPPYYVTTEDGFAGIIGERVSSVLDEAGIEYSIDLTPAKRQLHILKENRGTDCMVGWFLIPRRRAFAQYSEPIYQDRPMVALTREDHPAFIRPYTLTELITNQNLVMLMKDGYSYGLVIDFMIDHHRPKTLLTTAESSNMVKMIHAKRADYMIISVEEIEHVIAATNLPRNDFKTVFPGGMPPFNKRYLLFSKRVAPSVIMRVNKAIKKLYPIE